MDGIFQSGSETATRAVGSLGASGSFGMVFVSTLWNLDIIPFPAKALAGSGVARPELTLISS